MKSTYAEAAASCAPTPTEVTRFNETHDLSLVLGAQRSAQDARYSLGAVAGNSLVFTEVIGYDPVRIDKGEPQLTARHAATDEPRHRRTTAEENIIDNLPYSSLHMRRHWQTDTPVHYEWCRSRLLGVAAQDTGELGYRAELYVGLMDKRAFFVPGDTTHEQLSDATYRRIAEGEDIPERVFFDAAFPNRDLYTIIGELAAEHHDMDHFRDVALLGNLVRFDDSAYRRELGITSEERLPTYIVRNSNHHDSVTNLLDANKIKYRLAYWEEPQGVRVGSTFAPNAYSRAAQAERVARHLMGWSAVAGLAELAIPEVPKTDQARAIMAQIASQSLKRFATARELLIRAKAHDSYFNALRIAANRRAMTRLAKGLQPK